MAKHPSRDSGESPLYLKKVVLENVRCFKRLEFDLMAPRNRPRMWGVILGDNGVGKTTLLRSIAMGMCDEASAAGLLRELYGEWNRDEPGNSDSNRKEPAEVHLEFFPTDDADEINVTTWVTPNPLGYSRVRQTTRFGKSTTNFPWERIFACGYGAARRGFGTRDIDEYATLDAVYTLFNYDVPLQNPELVLRRVQAIKGDISPVLDSIAEILQLEAKSIELTPKGLTIKGDWGSFHAIRGLGDGFQATLAWLTDLIGWAIFYDQEADLSQLSGIVLIDELEQHLHPRWQRRMIGLLSSHFPNIQFVATTHTPMCAIGTTDLKKDSCKLIVLQRDGTSVTAIQDIAPPKGLRADQVLTSPLFGLASTTSDDLTQAVARYSYLRGKGKLTDAEKHEEKKLFVQLRQQLSSSETEFETEIRKQVSLAIKRLRDKTFDPQAVDFEVLRQLRNLTLP